MLSNERGHRRGCDRMVVGVMQSVPITTKAVSSNRFHDEVYSIQHYVIKSVGDLRQVGGFLRVLRFPPPMKVTARTSNLLTS
jgi:S-adenosylmethionine:tRNA-ribosyltransferase-isomerase (queuine synthetase)